MCVSDNNYFKYNMQHCTCNRRQIQTQRSEPALASHPDYYKTRSLDRSIINRSRDRRVQQDRSRSCSQISIRQQEPFSRDSLAYSSLPPVSTP